MSTTNEGILIRISGPVLDVLFEDAEREPQVNDLLVTEDGLHMEVAANLSPGVVRCVALEATDGLSCGTVVTNTGHPITVPVARRCSAAWSTYWPADRRRSGD
jgi:F-type H+-transporting ATPase subunit beta